MGAPDNAWVDDRPWPRRMASRIKVGLVNRRRKARARRIPPRHPNPYATHLPVLIGLAARARIRSVLELGSGSYSTPLFLNREVFRDVERLVSVENDREWAEKLGAELPRDARLETVFKEAPVPEIIDTLPVAEFDLVLIDDSAQPPERARTIAHMITRRTPEQSLVLHDFEMPEYREAAAAMPRQFVFDAMNPFTGLLWDRAAWNPRELKALKQAIRKSGPDLAPTDLEQWIRILQP